MHLPLNIQCVLKATLVLFTAGVLSACVSSSKYEDLEGKHKTLTEENEKNKATIVVAESKINELNGKLGIANTERSALEGSMADMKKALEEMQKRKLETEKRLGEFRELTNKFGKLVNAGKLSVKVVNGRMVVALSTDILFSSGSAKLSSEGTTAIKEVAALLKGLEGRNFQIEGHSDNVPIKTSVYPSNWELASARALTVVKTMLDAGLPAERISAASYADTQPIATNDNPEGRTQNRRIAITIMPDLSGLPGYQELNQMTK